MSDCIFCKIASGEIPAERIIEDAGFIAIRDIQPKAPQHLLVIPREHVVSLNDIDAWDHGHGQDLLSFVVKAADAVGIRDTGFRVVVNTGRDARQVVQHLHVHVMGGIDWEIEVSLLEQLQAQVKEAMKAGRKEEVGSLRLLISEIQKAAKDARHELDADAELQVLKRERKRRVEAAEAFANGNREELAARERREVALIDGFLPQQLDEAALVALVDDTIAELGATSSREMGKVMSTVMAKAGAQVDGKLASRLVKERLSA